jgi:hypothetical protein
VKSISSQRRLEPDSPEPCLATLPRRLCGCLILRLATFRLSGRDKSATAFSLRKEVIQPQVLLRLPCYDFTPIMNYTLDGCLSCELAHRLLVQPTFVM